MNAMMTDQIREHMDVVCSNDVRLGVVDHVEGDRIKLTKNHSPDGKHHYISADLVSRVDDKVHLSKPGAEVMKTWETA